MSSAPPETTTVLGIETSCDECSASVVTYRGPTAIEVRSLATFSQVAIHRPYGGVVPEIASRNHLETVNPMIDQALREAGIRQDRLAREIDAIAVTNRPGLVGALLVGISAGKALAYAIGKPLVPVHHLEGHAASVFLRPAPESAEALSAGGSPVAGPTAPAGASALAGNGELDIPLPLLLAIVSGGHTNLYVMRSLPAEWPRDFLKQSLIGRSRDDAAGEAFDKTAKLLGFPYPGGVWIDKTAKDGDPAAFALPRALPQKSSFDYSFSGLKTAVSLLAERLRKEGTLQERMPDVCASVQEAIVDALLTKIFLAVREFRCQSLAIVGGVAANRRLRGRLDAEWRNNGLAVPPLFPRMAYCTDNAAMIGAAGLYRFRQGAYLNVPELLTVNAVANPES